MVTNAQFQTEVTARKAADTKEAEARTIAVNALDARLDILEPLVADLLARIAKLEAPSTTFPGRVVIFDSTVTAQQIINAVADASVGVVQFNPTTYTPGMVRFNTKRVTPVLIQGVSSIFKPQTGQTDGAFQLGYGGSASKIYIDGLTFDAYTLSQTGIIWAGNCSDHKFNHITVQNSTWTGNSSPSGSWGLYLSYDAGVAASNIEATDWKVTGTGNRQISALQIQYAPLKNNIVIKRWTVNNVAFALYAVARVDGLVIDGFNITNSGINISSVYFGTGYGAITGTYANIKISNGSLPLVNSSNGGMKDLGGNTFS